MKTLPKTNSWPARRFCGALTILEMLVSTAMLAFIVLGLTAMLIQTQKAFKNGIKQSTITDSGRAVIDTIAEDLSQLSDPHFTNVPNPYFTGVVPYTGYNAPTNLFWKVVPSYDFVQYITNGNGTAVPFRTNQLEDVFALVQTNNQWLGIGYGISNWFSNNITGAYYPGIGTLYRYVTNVPGPLTNNNMLFSNFNYAIQSGLFTNCDRIADGVVHLKLTAYDASGNEFTNQLLPNSQYASFQYPVVVLNPTNSLLYITNYLPHSIDIELGVLEPDAFEHARAMFTSGATAAAGQYLTNCANQVDIYRQHIIIPAAP